MLLSNATVETPATTACLNSKIDSYVEHALAYRMSCDTCSHNVNNEDITLHECGKWTIEKLKSSRLS